MISFQETTPTTYSNGMTLSLIRTVTIYMFCLVISLPDTKSLLPLNMGATRNRIAEIVTNDIFNLAAGQVADADVTGERFPLI